MNFQEVVRLIESNGLQLHGDIHEFAELVAAVEREACAKACDELHSLNQQTPPEPMDPFDPDDCATAIRARGDA